MTRLSVWAANLFLGIAVVTVWAAPFSARGEAPYGTEWIRQQGTSGTDEAMDVSADTLGNVFIGGVGNGFLSRYDTLGNLDWTRNVSVLPLIGIEADGLGNVYATHRTDLDLPGYDSDAVVVKYDSGGNQLWSRQFGTPEHEHPLNITTDELGSAYVVGTTRGDLAGVNAGYRDGFIAKYDAAGTQTWIKQFAVLDDNSVTSVSTDALGNLFVMGLAFTIPGSDQPYSAVSAFALRRRGRRASE